MKKPKGLGEEDRTRIETAIGHTFAVKERLDRALTHSSAVPQAKDSDYERLEFLGDRFLGLCIAELLFKTFRNDEDGAVTVDWVVLTAAVVGLGILDMGVIDTAVGDLSDNIATPISSSAKQ